MKKTKIIAHRGYSRKYPENTMVAFRKAMNYHAAGVEIDVHFSKDQQLVVCHDESIDRTSNGTGLIKDLTFEELRQLRFDKGFEQLKLSDDEVRLPTLEEVIIWLKNTNLILNIEIKNNIYQYKGIEEAVIELVRKYEVEEQVIISSFNHYAVQKVKTIAPEIKCGFLTFMNILDIADYCKRYGVENYHPYYKTLLPNEITALQKSNIGINPYTINEETDMQQAIDEGITYIITNEVEKAVALIEQQN